MTAERKSAHLLRTSESNRSLFPKPVSLPGLRFFTFIRNKNDRFSSIQYYREQISR